MSRTSEILTRPLRFTLEGGTYYRWSFLAFFSPSRLYSPISVFVDEDWDDLASPWDQLSVEEVNLAFLFGLVYKIRKCLAHIFEKRSMKCC